MRYTVNIIVSIKDVIKKMDIEIPEYISNIQSFYLYLKEKCDLPQVNQGEVCICSKDKNRDITLFVITDTESVLYSPFEDISMFASIFPLYISYCSTIARAEEIFLANEGSHYYMWHESIISNGSAGNGLPLSCFVSEIFFLLLFCQNKP